MPSETTPRTIRHTSTLLLMLGLSVLPSPLAAGGRILRVTTPRQLLENLGPDRTIELAPGVYDLSTATEVSGPHLAWEEVFDGVAPVVHDLGGLTLRGPETGEARIEIDPRYADVLTLRRVRDVVLEGLVLGHADLPAQCGAGVLRMEDASAVTVRRTTLFGSGTVGLTLLEVRNGRFEEVTIRDTTERWMSLNGSEGVSFERCRFVGPPPASQTDRPIRLVDSWGVEIADTELVDPRAHGGAWIGRYLEADARSSARFRDSRAVDEVTGRTWPLTGVVPLPAEAELPARPYRAPDWTLERAEEEYESRAITLRLADGRSIPLTPKFLGEGQLAGGLDLTSVRVRSLAPGGLLLVRWNDLAAGMGLYQSGYYRVLGPAPGDPVLLSGEISHFGKAGMLDASRATFDVRYRDGVLSLREERVTHHSETRPLPLHHPETFEGEQYFTAVFETVEIRRWKYRGTRLEPIAHTLYYRVQEADTLEEVTEGLTLSDGEEIRREWIRTEPGGALPAPGQWLRIEKPVGAVSRSWRGRASSDEGSRAPRARSR